MITGTYNSPKLISLMEERNPMIIASIKIHKYLLRNDISIADVAIFPFVRQFANVDYEWFGNNFNQLTPWLEKISISDLFISIMNKYDTWNNTDKPCIIEF